MARNTQRRGALRVIRQEDSAPRNRQPASREETRRERTLRLGPQRISATVKAIRHLRQLANPATYDLRGDEPKKVVETLRTEIEQLEYELSNPGKRAQPSGIFDPAAE